MKRHKIYGPISEITRLSVCMMKEDPNGGWVKWEDVKDMVKIPCICEEMANKPDYEDHPDGLSPLPVSLPPWICPAHGYKQR